MAENTISILECLTNNIEKRIDIYVEESDTFKWEKSLKNMLLFTIKEIKLQRKGSSKIPVLAKVKTFNRGKTFKEGRYISADSITTSTKAEKNIYKGCYGGKSPLKKDHAYGYYTQIQMAMGLPNVQFYDFVFFTFKGMIIVRVPFDKNYFEQLVQKLNWFYKRYMLSKLKQNDSLIYMYCKVNKTKSGLT